MLNTETDSLEESNKEIREHIQKIVARGQLSEFEREKLKEQLEKDVEKFEIDIDKK